mgnify:FL=1
MYSYAARGTRLVLRRYLSTSSATPALTTADVSVLIDRVGSTREVRELIDYYAASAAQGPDAKVVAVVKVSGDFLVDAAAVRELSSSLATLSRAGMLPIVVHGAGSQLSATLEAEGIESDFIGGQRVTTPEILGIAKRVFREHNERLVGAIEAAGARARPIGTSALEAVAGSAELGFVGELDDAASLNVEVIRACARDGCIPVICSLGETSAGQVLNVNSDVVAKTVAIATGAKHVIHVNDAGGLRDKEGKKIKSLEFPAEYDALMSEEWARPGFKLQLGQFKDVLESLSDASTVVVTHPAGILPHLFSTRTVDSSDGTVLRRSEGVRVVRDLASPRLDLARLTSLLERSFSAESGQRIVLRGDHFERIGDRLHAIYFSPSYRSAAIVLTDEADKTTFYLDKFALAPTAETGAPAFGLADQLWDRMRADLPTLFWRSHNTMRLDEWFLSRCDGCMRTVALAEQTGKRGATPSSGSAAAVAAAAAAANAPHPDLPSWAGVGAAMQTVDVSAAGSVTTAAASDAAVLERDAAAVTAATAAAAAAATAVAPWTVFWYGLDSPMHPHRKDLVGQVQRIGLVERSFVEPGSAAAAAGSQPIDFTTGGAPRKVGIVGARGYTGAELVRILAGHPSLAIAHASSRALAGDRVLDSIPLDADVVAANPGLETLCFESPTPDVLLAPENEDVALWVLAMPNGFAPDYVDAARSTGAALVDLSADHRFVCGPGEEWAYGLPELTRSALGPSSKFVANPVRAVGACSPCAGCYLHTTAAAAAAHTYVCMHRVHGCSRVVTPLSAPPLRFSLRRAAMRRGRSSRSRRSYERG